ncbi:MAG: signal peptidase I [Proteobacteria bacterium]|nr:signal peptidase I [Pseudomonadota bacterium]HQR04745.1 signal peptidase I [Rhodocyclaceae bacterium]
MNFALILFLLCIATGILWCLDKWVFRRKRSPGSPDPWWVEYGASFFPVILLVFLLRSFLVEPYKIPSGSMIPTLLVGDFILVNKYTYGIRLPVINKKVMAINSPQRGDVMVFRWPVDPSLDYIKRVVGVPGDRISYFNKHLLINGKEVTTVRDGDFLDRDKLYYTPRYTETLGQVKHSILIAPDAPPSVTKITQFPYQDNCHYNAEGLECVVPPGHYFMMGDNRDNSQDSRYWGFVPDENIVGKAFFIWFNFSDLKRIGTFN